MTWFILAVAALVLLLFIALIMGWVGGGMGSPTSSLSHEPLPDTELHDDDVAQIRFDVGARGYRMSQVDAVVDRLRRELREKDEQVAQLRADSRTGPGSDPGNRPPDAAGPGPSATNHRAAKDRATDQTATHHGVAEGDEPEVVGGIETEHPHHVNPAAVFEPEPSHVLPQEPARELPDGERGGAHPA